MDKIETYFRVFLENLISNKGSKQNVNQTHYPKTLEKLFGTSISKELSEMLGAIEKNESIFCLGELYNFDSSYLNFLDESSNKNAFECLLKSRSSPFMLVSIFTNTISFGGDGSGNIFYAEIDKQGSKIFFQDHENETSLLLIAESLPVFIYLNGIQEDLENFKNKLEVSSTELFNYNNDSELVTIKQKLTDLNEKVNLVSWGFSHLKQIYEVKELHFSPINPYLLVRSYPLIKYLETGMNWFPENYSTQHLSEFEKEKTNNCAASKLFWLWYFYLFNHKELLDFILNEYANDNAVLVKEAVRLIKELIDKSKRGEIGYLNSLKYLLNRDSALINLIEEEQKKNLLVINEGDSDVVKKLKEKMVQPDFANNYLYWDNLSYHYYLLEDANNMLATAIMSITINRHSYYSWSQKGIAHQLKNELAEALHAFDCALAINRIGSNAANSWFNKSNIYVLLNDFDNAIAHLKIALENNSELKKVLIEDKESMAFYGDRIHEVL